jgi:type III restriction enzyme
MQLKNYQQRCLEVLSRYFQSCLQTGDADLAFYNVTRQLFDQGIPYHQVAELPGMPYVCLRVPTGGGKTLIACHSVSLVVHEYQRVDHGLVLWLAPSKTIRDQTINALKDRKHPYRLALESTLGAVTVLDLSEAQYLQPTTLNTETVILVSTNQAFRVEDPELRKVYETSGALMSHFENVSAIADVERYQENGKPIPSLANLLRLHRPMIIVDEAHNVRSDISFMTLKRFNPSGILEFTATPKLGNRPSNVLYSISARELKAEAMIKMPIRLEVRPQWKELIGDAINTLKGLEQLAEIERAETGDYIRPIMLLQAQPRRQGQRTITVDVVEACLQNDYGIPPEQIKRATGEDNQIEGLDLLAHGDVRYIITVQALREGWDCPFAYVLCSVAEQYGATAVEQIVGRVLRMPQATRKSTPELNMAYAFVASNNFAEALGKLKDALLENGFQKQEIDEMMALHPTSDFGPLFSSRTSGGHSIAFKVEEAPALYNIPADLAGVVKYDAQTQTIEFPVGLTPDQVAAIAPAFSSPAVRQSFIEHTQASRTRIVPPNATLSERGETISVPVLALRQGKLLEQFEETHFLDFDWELSKQDVSLNEAEFPSKRSAPQQAEVDISDEGKIRTAFLSNLQDQMTLLKVEQGWKVSDLVYWLDRNILHRDITATESGVFLTRLVTNLSEKRGFSLDTLVRDKYRLRDAAAAKMDSHRKGAHAQSFTQFFREDSPLEVSPDLVFTFDPEEYPAPVNSLYRGMHQFKKHYYPDVGDLKSTGEEHECAQIIDSLDEIACWVRNIDSQPSRSFWLQTSRGRFYPDFVCKLTDGRILVVEYKGSHLYTDAEEKRIIGELWEKRSNGRCLFVMPTNREFGGLRAKVAKTAKYFWR